jgi:hypothetical protein
MNSEFSYERNGTGGAVVDTLERDVSRGTGCDVEAIKHNISNRLRPVKVCYL